MRNLRGTIWNLRLPPVIGVVFLVLSIGTLTWLTGNTVIFGTKAAADDTPRDVQITNITDNSFTVSYRTDAKVIGSINYGMTTSFGAVALDARDASESATATEHWIHSFTIKDLTAATKHYFAIASGDDTFLNGAVPYEVTTSSVSAMQPTSHAPLTGTIQDATGGIPTEAIVYVSLTEGQLLSGMVKVDGSYEIPLNAIRKKDLSGQLTLADNTPILLTVQDATTKSNVQVVANQTNPVPMVILSKDYNFTISNDPVASNSASASDSATITPAAFPTTAATGSAEPKIISPEQDQEFKDQQPTIKGRALPNTEVSITIHSDAGIQTTVTSDTDGNWEYRPEKPLDPGDHTVTVETPDSSGLMKTLTQQFTVFAEGSQFTEPTGLPTLAPTKAQVVTPTPTPPGVTPTTAAATPAATIAPTIAATVVPTIAPTSSAIITQPPIPKTGSSAMIVGFIATVIFIGIGALVIVL